MRKALLVGGVVATRIEIVNGHFVVIAHPAEENRPARAKTAPVGKPIIVPFADSYRRVTGFPKLFGPERRTGRDVIRLHGSERTVEASAGQKHCAARGADRRDRRSHAKRVGEGEAAVNEAVEVRSFDVPVAERGDSVESLIVAQQEHDIRRPAQQIGPCRAGERNEQERRADKIKCPRRMPPGLCPRQ